MNTKLAFDIEFRVYDKAVVCYATPIKVDEEIKVLYNTLQKLGRAPKGRLKSYKGVAVYKEGDKFDVEMGKAIARKKAIRAAYSDLTNLVGEIADLMIDVLRQKTISVLKKYNQMDREIDELVH